MEGRGSAHIQGKLQEMVVLSDEGGETRLDPADQELHCFRLGVFARPCAKSTTAKSDFAPTSRAQSGAEGYV